MPRYVCEGMMLRVDDPWAKDNNQEYWLDMNDLARVTDIPEEDISGLRNSFQLFDSRADAGRVKQLIVESAIRLLEKQKEEGTRPKGKTARLVSEMTGVTENYVREYIARRNKGKEVLSEEEMQKAEGKRKMQRIRSYMRFMNENLDAYDWPEVVNSLSEERKLAEELIEKLKRSIIEGDEEMKKMTVDYQLEDTQYAYLGKIHEHYPQISEEDLFMMIMIEGSSMDISRRLQEFGRRTAGYGARS